jgi:ABC-type glycerol-3-phosphate transport system substrate-binding protein
MVFLLSGGGLYMKVNLKVMLLLLVVSVVVSLTGCGDPKSNTGESPGQSPASGSDKVTLNVLLSSNPDTNVLKEGIPDFEKETGIKINLTEVPQDQLNTKLSVEMGGKGSSFDVSGFQYELIPGFADNLLPIESYISEEDKKDILPAALDAAKYKDHIYGHLYVTTGMILFYREDLFKEKNLQVPKTWDEYLQTAKALTSKSPETWGTIVTAKPVGEPVGMYLNYLYQNGGDIIDSSGNVTINDPKAVAALQFMVDQVQKEKVAPPGAVNYWTQDTANLFKEGKLAMAPNWSYMYGVANADDSKVKGKVGIALLPAKEKNAITLGGWTLSALKSTKHPAEAYKFIQFMTDSKRQKTMALKGGNTPSRNSTINDPEVSKIPLYSVMFEALKTSVSRTKYTDYAQIENALGIAISASVSGTESPKDALDTAAKKIQQAKEKSK